MQSNSLDSMKIQNKTLKNGFTIPLIGKGTWMPNLGRKPRPSLNDKKFMEEIQVAIDMGISYIDTAERYMNGYREKLLGQAIKGKQREKLFLVSKVSSDNVGYKSVIESAKASIKRLQTSYLDLYLIHQFNPSIDLKETMRAMDYLIDHKLIKNIGVCDFTVKQLQEAQSYTKNKIVVNQLHFNLMYRSPEQMEVVKYCQKNDIMVIAWRPFQQNLLTPKIKILLEEMASKYARTPFQIATAWLTSQPNIVVLTNLDNATQIEKVTDAIQVQIEQKDLEKFNSNHN